MTDNWVIMDFFFRAGYIFTALVVTVLFLARRTYTLPLASVCNGIWAFFALCMTLLSLVSRHIGWITLEYALVVALFLLVKKRPLLLFIPFAALAVWTSADRDLLLALLTDKSYVLLLMGMLYFLLTLIFYLLYLLIKRIMN